MSDIKTFTDCEIMELRNELAQRYPELYKGIDKPFAYWVSEIQRYGEWKQTSDWPVAREQMRSKQ